MILGGIKGLTKNKTYKKYKESIKWCNEEGIKLEKKFFFMKDKYIIFIFSLYIADLLLITKTSFTGDIRTQDIATLLAVPIFFYALKRINVNFNINKIILSISVYFLYLLITNLIIYATGINSIKFIFYIIKELEYMIGMLIVFYCGVYHREKMIKIISILIFINIIYGVCQFGLGKISYYGIGAISDSNPAASGLVYFMCAILSFIIFINKKNSKYIIYFILSIGLTILTISKTNILGVVIFIAIYVVLYIMYRCINKIIKIKKTNILIIANCIIAMIILVVIADITRLDSIILENDFISRIIYRFSRSGHSFSFRMNKAEYYYNSIIGDSVLRTLFGAGKGIPEYYFKASALGVDNQYVRFIIEMGYLGTSLWIIQLGFIGVKLRKASSKVY